ncbi:MAG: tetratricopeptide repeat protein [Candidatus Methanoplasma sp.]|jgi:tetratricopeptide (TPR) repeat protein|nr:tetratricopeptide repeat protein [Candidatus Methanoplasma sp.]
MDQRPVFRSKFEANVWRRLTADAGMQSKKGELYADVAGSLLKHDGPVHSAILVKTMEKLRETNNPNLRGILPKLVSKSRGEDCGAALAASMILMDIDDLEGARSMVGTIRSCHNIPLAACVKARILMADGDPVKAKRELMRARCSNPTYTMFYDLVQQLEPSEGWMYRKNIELLVAGKETFPCGESGRVSTAESLYSIYRDWYGGMRDEATRLIVASEEYKNKSPEFVLASARMSMDEKDWHSAQRMYDLLLSVSSNCVYIICEAACAHSRGGNHERALALYRSAEALDPASHTVIKGLMDALLALGMAAEAAQCVRDLCKTEDASAEDFYAGARVLMKAGMHSEVPAVMEGVMITYPEDSEAYVLRSEAEFAEGKINAAISTIDDGIDRNPKDPGCRLQKASVLFKTGKVGQAIKELERAQKTDPGNVGVIVLLKDIAVASHNNKEAVRLSNEILKLDPTNADAMNIVSKSNLSSKGQSASYSEYKDMITENGRADNFVNVLGALISDGRHKDAIQMCREKGRDLDGDPMVLRLRGNAEYALGEYKKASASYASAAAKNPEDPMLWYSKGMADEAGEDLDAAEDAFNMATLGDPNEPMFWISKAAVQEKRGQLSGAVDSLNKAIELCPGSPFALVRKGIIFAGTGKFREAMHFVDMAIAMSPGNVDMYRVQRDICLAAGEYDRASELSDRILLRDPTNADAIAGAVAVYTDAGRREDARRILDGALAKDPTSVPLLVQKKEFCIGVKDFRGAIDACERMLSIQPDNVQIKSDLADALSAAGDKGRADLLYLELGSGGGPDRGRSSLNGRSTNRKKVPDNVKRSAERLLRRAFVAKAPLDDHELLEALDMDDAMTAAIKGYLSDIEEYGDIVVGSQEFDRMEKLSMNLLSKDACDPETDPVVSLQCAYVAGGSKDADEAKRLVAYIHKVMTTKLDKNALSPETRASAEGVSENAKMTDISKRLRVGAYAAKLIRDR